MKGKLVDESRRVWLITIVEEIPVHLLTHRGWKPLPLRFSSQNLQLGEEDGHIHGGNRCSCIMRVRRRDSTDPTDASLLASLQLRRSVRQTARR